MTDRQIAIRILLTGVVLILGAVPLLSGCAGAPSPVLILSAGSTICTTTLNGECERLKKIGDTLHTREMQRRIDEAKAFQVIR